MMPPNGTFREALDVMFPNRPPKHNPIESIRRWLYPLSNLVRRGIRHMEQRFRDVLSNAVGYLMAAAFAFTAPIIILDLSLCQRVVALIVGWGFLGIFTRCLWQLLKDADKNDNKRRGAENNRRDEKLIIAVNKAAERINQKLSDTLDPLLINHNHIDNREELDIETELEDRENAGNKTGQKLTQGLRQSLKSIARQAVISPETIEVGLRQNKKARGYASLMSLFR